MKPAEVYGQKPDCIFCKDDKQKNVYNKQVVYETRYWAVLVDNNPLSKGHLLLMPKAHVNREWSLSDAEVQERDKVKQKIVQVFRDRFQTDEFFEMTKHGKKAGQSILHLHIHLIPSSGFLDQFTILFNTSKKMLCGCCARPMSKSALAAEQRLFKESFARVQ
jgi:histidine triad (HIT) family protein